MSNEIVYERYDSIKYSPAWKWVSMAQAEMFASKTEVEAMGASMLHGNEKVIIARTKKHESDEYMTVGFMAFEAYDDGKYLWITYAWTNPVYRRHGIHTKMFALLKRYGEENGAFSVNSTIGKDNLASLESADAQGRRRSSISFTVDIPQPPAEVYNAKHD